MHNFLKQPCILPQDVTLPNSINSVNFWHIFDSGLKFKILKPNSSWLTFGISKFVSLSISCFLFLFLQLFLHCAVRHQPFGYYTSKLLSFWLLHQKLLSFWLLHLKLPSFWLLHLKITIILAISSQNLILSYCIKLSINTNCHIRHFSCKS